LQNQTIINTALELNEACWVGVLPFSKYFSRLTLFGFDRTRTPALCMCFHPIPLFWLLRRSRTGIGPEAFAFESSDGNFTGGSDPSAAQQASEKAQSF
jgi:hypothetical protein